MKTSPEEFVKVLSQLRSGKPFKIQSVKMRKAIEAISLDIADDCCQPNAANCARLVRELYRNDQPHLRAYVQETGTTVTGLLTEIRDDLADCLSTESAVGAS